jgi:flagellar biogenesis protein FliO
MTRRRLPSARTLTVAVALLGSTVSRLALAEGSAELVAPAQAALAPDASVSAPASARPWLRAATKPAQTITTAAPAPSPWRTFGVLIVLGVLGGAVLVAKQRRRLAAPVLPDSATRVRVLSSARIGPKANAVVAEVGGRVLLLGVTDTSVARLAWLDRAPAREAAPEAPKVERHMLSREPVETAEADLEPPKERSMTARFGEVLDRALGVKPASKSEFRGNPGVAALLASSVEDVVEARGTARVPTQRLGMSAQTIIEDQVAGLKRSRRRS